MCRSSHQGSKAGGGAESHECLPGFISEKEDYGSKEGEARLGMRRSGHRPRASCFLATMGPSEPPK